MLAAKSLHPSAFFVASVKPLATFHTIHSSVQPRLPLMSPLPPFLIRRKSALIRAVLLRSPTSARPVRSPIRREGLATVLAQGRSPAYLIAQFNLWIKHSTPRRTRLSTFK